MPLAIPTIAWLAIHFTLYTLWARHTAALKQEKGIFLYHAVSYALLTAALATAGLLGGLDRTGTATGFAAGLHGIYSLSFLESWSLTQGSYSLAILDRIERSGGGATAGELAGLQQVGTRKRQLRADDVGRLGLVRPDGSLSTAGRAAAILLRLVLRVSNGRVMN